MAGELLVARYQGLVRSCVRPYWGGPVSNEDLMQVGYVGLLKAIGNASGSTPTPEMTPGNASSRETQLRIQLVA